MLWLVSASLAWIYASAFYFVQGVGFILFLTSTASVLFIFFTLLLVCYYREARRRFYSEDLTFNRLFEAAEEEDCALEELPANAKLDFVRGGVATDIWKTVILGAKKNALRFATSSGSISASDFTSRETDFARRPA